MTWGTEEEVVMAFERECDARFTPKDHLVERYSRMRPGVSRRDDLVHPRRSVLSSRPFTLSVPRVPREDRSWMALVGPNGSAKSTLSRSLWRTRSHCSSDRSPSVGGIWTGRQLQN